MASRQAIGIVSLFTIIMLLSGEIHAGQQPVKKIVRIGEEVQKKDGVEYHRIAILYDDALFERIDSTRDVWFFNGKALGDVALPEATLLGQYKYRNILIAWPHSTLSPRARQK